MAQLTERLVREFLSYADRGEHPPMTANEARQLCYSWLQAHGLSTHADSPAQETAPEHRCGVQGFDQMKGDVCPACSAGNRRTDHA